MNLEVGGIAAVSSSCLCQF